MFPELLTCALSSQDSGIMLMILLLLHGVSFLPQLNKFTSLLKAFGNCYHPTNEVIARLASAPLPHGQFAEVAADVARGGASLLFAWVASLESFLGMVRVFLRLAR